MDNPQQFVTTVSILSFGGASLAVLIVSIALQRVFAKTWIFIPFLTALIVGFTVAQASNALSSPLEWLIAFVNACLLFCTVTGANELVAGRPTGGTKPQGRTDRKLFESWFS